MMEVWNKSDPAYAEWQGVVILDVPIALRAMSGRSKHTDPEEQGMAIAQSLEMHWREILGKIEKGSEQDDIRVGSVALKDWREGRWTDWS
jgi:hypothetical protein